MENVKKILMGNETGFWVQSVFGSFCSEFKAEPRSGLFWKDNMALHCNVFRQRTFILILSLCKLINLDLGE